jgi:hypothetical protein
MVARRLRIPQGGAGPVGQAYDRATTAVSSSPVAIREEP